MLHSEAASETAARLDSDNDAITVVRFGEYVYTQIRRFVVVKVKKGFVDACPISTYSGRGTRKQGCNPAEHAIVYCYGSSPGLLDNEYGITKEPICIYPADSSIRIHEASRVRFSKSYPIEMNVKVKDIGKVMAQDMSKLAKYYKEADGSVDSD
ncbi:hypothetical protein K469DRAFT_596050 [Zopfia rhizophila CBS 207.26]|uniref:DUF6590 domain-containing protein n=1 Tax=Zopfia rhizophila CBS 207.26 TaxID=1314779 RepID=A0A6A6DIW9_9PEZI|nr:hypothetical protein K469DRAFT_596050 [Zopfia rhizophila CBS 207.26]